MVLTPVSTPTPTVGVNTYRVVGVDTYRVVGVDTVLGQGGGTYILTD